MATWTKVTEWFSPNGDNDTLSYTIGGNLKLNLKTRELMVEGKTLLLTDDEIDLLLFVTKHPKHFVSPHTSLSTRWNESSTGKSEFLRVLCSLQRKLEAAGVKGRYIRVEPWYLYCFDPTA